MMKKRNLAAGGVPIPPIGTAGIEPASEPESKRGKKTALSCHWTMFREYVGAGEASTAKLFCPPCTYCRGSWFRLTLCTNPELWVATAAKPDDQLRDSDPGPRALTTELS